ncbi:hypothetical protein, variant 1 [Aphanomyces astaci]|uniref:Uncharacterized protein n=1 Tax=Aphanomyces astaci TaxID=112090 RepID=W4G868_APHAT|nr:hypothetical protein, variant 1 [Aphanomyces astaci]ETV75902.1 hypothetical protein, variant 1 [Aphanomyces astaci]|eukprot:XP_009834545.1 hypothetical protein, variant 1 [Aphanomyces astaci]
MSSTATGSSSSTAATSKHPTVECDVCVGMTMYTSAMRDANEKPICVGFKSTKCEIDQQGFVELLEKRQQEAAGSPTRSKSATTTIDQEARLRHIEAFLAALSNVRGGRIFIPGQLSSAHQKPQPKVDATAHDSIYAPEKDSFRYMYWGLTLYSSTPTNTGHFKHVLPLCVGVSYLQRSKPSLPATADVASRSVPAPSPFSRPADLALTKAVDPEATPVNLLGKMTAACNFTAMAMVKYADRQATNFPERYTQSMQRLVDNMHVQWGSMTKLAIRIVTFGGSKKDS